MKRFILIAVLMALFTMNCAGNDASFKSSLDVRTDELAYENGNKKPVEKNGVTLAIGSFAVDDVLPPDMTVVKTSSTVVPLLFYDSWHYTYRAKLGYNRIVNDYKNFMRESLIQEVKKGSPFLYRESQGELMIDVAIKKIGITAPIDHFGLFALPVVVYIYYDRVVLGPLEVDVQAEVTVKNNGSVTRKKEVHGRHSTNIGWVPVRFDNAALAEYTTVMIEGLSLAIRDLNENIVKMVNDTAPMNASPATRSPEKAVADVFTAPTITGPLYKDPVTGMEFVFVRGGCYRMGDIFGDGGFWQRPVHEVCIDDFYLGKHEVTEGQWKAVMGDTPTENTKGDGYPVRGINWEEAHTFALKLKYKTGVNYRLPTEAEWEYAARDGGKDQKWPGTNSESELTEYAWYSALQEKDVKAVGLKKPNTLGLHDMAGNVQEWTSDWYSIDYYEQSPKNNPRGPRWASDKVLRGGSVQKNAADLRTTERDHNRSTNAVGDIGFRLMIQPD